jgi:uncharacterized Tic20 family protein
MDAQTLPVATLEPTTEERNWAMAAHLSALIAVAGLPFGHVIGPLIVFLSKGNESNFVREHARTSLNYQITISIAAIIAVIVGIVVFAAVIIASAGASPHHEGASDALAGGMIALWIGIFFIVGAFVVISLIFIIMATMAAGQGKPYHYPFSINFVR